ncbi:hypothetical protein tb265_40680 [Gemmatimonadetes bacterium T265]|nr:hypothetical protein tb265_40680 [Gemmatimonadetes bacterium T265]
MASNFRGAGVNLLALLIAAPGAVAAALILAMVLPWPLDPLTGLVGVPVGWATYRRWGAGTPGTAAGRGRGWPILRSHAVRAAPLYAVVLWTAWAWHDPGRGAFLFGTVPLAPGLAALGGLAALTWRRRSPGAGAAPAAHGAGAPAV